MNDDQPRSRRGVLAAALGAVAGSVVATVARPQPADAAPTPVYIAQDNASTGRTRLYRTDGGVVFSMFTPTMPAFQQGNEVLSIGSNVGAPAIYIEQASADGSAIVAHSAGAVIHATSDSTVAVDANGDPGIRAVGVTAAIEAVGWGNAGTSAVHAQVLNPGADAVFAQGAAG